MTEAYPNLVAGRWQSAEDEAWKEVRNPADRREVVGRVPAMTVADVEEVYRSAAAAKRGWSDRSGIERGRVLLEASSLLRERKLELARDLSREMGKRLGEAEAEVEKSADFFEYYSSFGRLAVGSVLPHEQGSARSWTISEPLGVVLAITPWNDPLLTPARKLAPALIAGNAVVLKPASHTPIVAHHLARVLLDAGVPDGVVSTVTGDTRALAGSLLLNPALDAVSFTGSNEVGEELQRTLAGTGIKLLAELGGKNAALVLADADLELATAAILNAGFAQAGQRCTATSRLLVASEVAAEFQERLTTAASALVVGPGLEADTEVGPLVSDEQRKTVADYVQEARAEAEVLVGGRQPDDPQLAHGSFYEPTVIAGVSGAMPVWREEIFGPVIAMMEVDGLERGIQELNDSPYGLAAALYTADVDAVERFISGVEVGQVAVNLPTTGWDVHMPFGGFKGSGTGFKEQGEEGLRFYSRTKTVALGKATA
jgi:aldehyde dehydrogenase (NAD+)